MQYFSKIQSWLSLLALVLIITSCSRENIDDTEVKEGEVDIINTTGQNDLLSRSSSTSDGLLMECLTVVYPFDMVEQDGTVQTIVDEASFDEAIFTYEIVDFVYPLQVMGEMGASVANSPLELGDLFGSCLPDSWTTVYFPAYIIDNETSCLSLDYPLTVIDIEDQPVKVENEEELIAELAAQQLFFQFPFQLLDGDNVVVNITDVDALLETLFSCNEYEVDSTQLSSDFEYLGCYNLEFPFEVVLIDGSVVKVDDHEQYCDLLLFGTVQDFHFPLTLEDGEGQLVEVTNNDELNTTLDDCYYEEFIADAFFLYTGGVDNLSGIPCFDIQYPIDLNGGDPFSFGLTLTVGSNEAFTNLVGFLDGSIGYSVAYPVDIVTYSGQEISLFDSNDLFAILTECN